MPLYEYQCESCGHRFELIQKFSDPPAETCPACGKGPVQKLVSSPAFQFKGTGWYVTDYARKSDGGSDSKDKAPKADADSSKSESSDKPADKPAEKANEPSKKS